MTTKLISQITTSATSIGLTDFMEIDVAGTSKKVTGKEVQDRGVMGSHPGYRSGEYYAQHQNREDQANGVNNNTVYFYPFHIRRPCSVSGLTVLNNSSVASSKARAALYSMPADLAAGITGTKLAETAATFDISVGITRIDQAFAAPLVFTQPTWCWMMTGYSGAALSMYGFSTNDACMESILGCSSSTNVFGSDSFIKGFSAPYTFGALPADLSALSLSEVVGGMPKALIKIS